MFALLVLLTLAGAAFSDKMVFYDMPYVIRYPDLGDPVTPVCYKAEFYRKIVVKAGSTVDLYMPNYGDHMFGFILFYQYERKTVARPIYQLYSRQGTWMHFYARHTRFSDMNNNYYVPSGTQGRFYIKNIQKHQAGQFTQIAVGFWNNYKHACFEIEVED